MLPLHPLLLKLVVLDRVREPSRDAVHKHARQHQHNAPVPGTPPVPPWVGRFPRRVRRRGRCVGRGFRSIACGFAHGRGRRSVGGFRACLGSGDACLLCGISGGRGALCGCVLGGSHGALLHPIPRCRQAVGDGLLDGFCSIGGGPGHSLCGGCPLAGVAGTNRSVWRVSALPAPATLCHGAYVGLFEERARERSSTTTSSLCAAQGRGDEQVALHLRQHTHAYGTHLPPVPDFIPIVSHSATRSRLPALTQTWCFLQISSPRAVARALQCVRLRPRRELRCVKLCAHRFDCSSNHPAQSFFEVKIRSSRVSHAEEVVTVLHPGGCFWEFYRLVCGAPFV